MTTRRQFCKNLCAAGLMPATLTSFAKFYCGMDFGSGDSTTVWHKIIPSEVYSRGGRASTKSLYPKPPERKSKSEDKKAKVDKLRWLWFEEASEFKSRC